MKKSIQPYIIKEPLVLSALATDALAVFGTAVNEANPYESTCKALKKENFSKCRFVLSIGKASVPMMQAAYDTIGEHNIQEAVVVTKYGHLGEFNAAKCTCFESGHPISDENSEKAARYVLQKTADLKEEDICVVLLSGGGSALFELPLIKKDQQQNMTDILLKSGADIYELNCIRKRISAIKGGRLATHMAPAKIFTFALSDVPGSRPDVIASGPTQPDPASDDRFAEIVKRYNLNKDGALNHIPPKAVFTKQPHFCIVGDVNRLCSSAANEAQRRGYTVVQTETNLTGDAQEAVKRIISTALQYRTANKGKYAFIYGGETTVTVKGNGKGGRSQQAALFAATLLKDLKDVVFLAGSSDGTDGPTDAAGGLVDGNTAATIENNEKNVAASLANNDAYNALLDGNALLMTGPTGTNVNDLFLIFTE